MLPASYSSRADVDSFSREKDLTISRKMKKFYKTYHMGENMKIDDKIHKLENIIVDNDVDDADDIQHFSTEKSVDFNENIIDSETIDADIDDELKKKYNPLITSSRNIKYPFSQAIYSHLNQDIDFLDELKFEKMSEHRDKELVIELCIYHINTCSHKPFLEFMLYKSPDDGVMYFPSFVYDDTTDSILEKSEDILGNIVNEDNEYIFKGRIGISDVENIIEDANIDNRIILLFELKRKNTEVVHITDREHFWWATVSEIFNYKKVLFYDVSNTATDVFLSCVDMIKIYYKKSLIETPGVFYHGNNKNTTKYNAILSLNKSPTESRYGPHYYFTDLHTSMKYACYDADNRKRERSDGAGIVRFIVFHGKMKMFMKNDKVDNSKMAEYIFERYHLEKKTGQFRDNDCIWTRGYNSAYNGYHNIQYYTRTKIDTRDKETDVKVHASDTDTNSDSDDADDSDDALIDLKHTLETETYIKRKKKRATIILAMRLCIDEYSFQTPISYHYVDINDADMPKTYDYNFRQYKIL
jgi:hypothetical protein